MKYIPQLFKMADEETVLCELASLEERLDQYERSWIEVKDILEKLKSWAIVKSNR